jgi:N6-adenosine-specific RNA methylase IME4
VADLIILPARRQYWARRINEAWDAGVAAIFKTGQRLIEAKADPDLPHGQFEAMVTEDLRFSASTGQRLMKVARDRKLANPAHGPLLPPSWRTLYEITKLTSEQFQALLDDGTIRPDVERDVIVARRRAFRRDAKQAAHRAEIIGGLVSDLQRFIDAGHRVGTIYADPPWLYDNQTTRSATSTQYKGLTVDELCKLPVGKLADDDAHLHLWTTNGFLFDCPKLFTAWGFEFKSSFVWVKPEIGIGNYWRNAHEFLLTAVRGDAKRFNDHNLRSWLECSRGKHSRKPYQIRSFLEKASPGPRIELFARDDCPPNWFAWGHQIGDSLLSQGQRRIA